MNEIVINGKNSYKDYGLVAREKIVINPPEPIIIQIEVPGRAEVIDASESLTGKMEYKNRSGSIDFLVIGNIRENIDKAVKDLHGKKVSLFLMSDNKSIYEGRIYISDIKVDKNNTYLTLSYNLNPYKKKYKDNSELEFEEVI